MDIKLNFKLMLNQVVEDVRYVILGYIGEKWWYVYQIRLLDARFYQLCANLSYEIS